MAGARELAAPAAGIMRRAETGLTGHGRDLTP